MPPGLLRFRPDGSVSCVMWFRDGGPSYEMEFGAELSEALERWRDGTQRALLPLLKQDVERTLN